MPSDSGHSVLLYDGVCGLCNRAIQFVLKRDFHDAFRFASLQSDFAVSLLRKHGLTPEALDTMYLVLDHNEVSERLLARSDAALEVARRLGGIWRALSKLKLLPKFFRNFIYNRIARNRYQIFGKYDACPLPTPEQRTKFLDQ
jgi:predicted DCC family thiol-disulfide oxidoreductase YuxK